MARRRPKASRRRAAGPRPGLLWLGTSSLSPTPLTTTPTLLYYVDQTVRDSFNFNDSTFLGGWINISAYASAAGPANFSTMAFNLVEVELDSTDSVAASLITELDPSLNNWQPERNVLWHWHGMVSGNMNGVAASVPTYIRERVNVKRKVLQGNGIVLIASSNNPTASEVFWTFSNRFLVKVA